MADSHVRQVLWICRGVQHAQHEQHVVWLDFAQTVHLHNFRVLVFLLFDYLQLELQDVLKVNVPMFVCLVADFDEENVLGKLIFHVFNSGFLFELLAR